MRRLENRRRASIAITLMFMQIVALLDSYRRYRFLLPRSPYKNNDRERNVVLRRMFTESDIYCHEQLRMNRAMFYRLCVRLRRYGLVDSRHVKVEEQVALFLHTIGQDLRNRKSAFEFFRSGETVSKYFHRVLSVLLVFYKDVVKPATVANSPADCTVERDWHHYFKDAVGAIDGTQIQAHVPLADQPRYRNRKQIISQNVLVACTFDMKFTYVLAGWEGSVHDGRMFRNALSREGRKLTVPVGKYYLADAGFPFLPGFLTPYRGTRYHLRDHVGRRPENFKELFNFRHSSLRNVIERTIEVLKKRFAYLRNAPFHDIETQSKIIIACCAVHNFLRDGDPHDLCEEDSVAAEEEVEGEDDETTTSAASQVWTSTRDTMAERMWNER